MLKIYCDGACSGNPGPGGWAFVIPELKEEHSGYCSDTTNNRMEIQAVIEALNYVNIFQFYIDEVEIITDSQYVVNTMTKGWQKKKNLDLWGKLDAVIAKFQKIKWTWVKGHSDNPYNKRCDELAVQEYKNINKKGDKNIMAKFEELPISDYEYSNYMINVTFRLVKKFDVNGVIYRMYYNNAFLQDFFVLDRNEQHVSFVGSEKECLDYLEQLKNNVTVVDLSK